MANYPYELAQDAAYQSHTGRLTGLCFLPKLAQGLNTNNNNNYTLMSVAFNKCSTDGLAVVFALTATLTEGK
jgi:hypothetical protein